MTGEGRVKLDEGGWLTCVEAYEIGVFRDHEVIRGRLLPSLHEGHPRLDAALASWPGSWYLREAEEGTELLLVRPPPGRPGPRWWLHGLLFLATLFTTHMAGALLAGVDPLGTVLVQPLGVPLPLPTRVDWGALAAGSPFALTFLGILLAHEAGHWTAARRHGIAATPPYFIPFPAYWSIVGTLGAFIRVEGPTVRRSILLDIGAAGPLASFVLSIPVLWIGLGLSGAVAGPLDPATPYVVPFAGYPVWIGDGLLMHGIVSLRLPAAAPIVLHPVAFAGWLGLFVTALNLLPVGQLDGGHVLYALGGRVQHVAGRLFLAALLPLGLLWWGWWLWGLAAFAVNRGRVGHPPLLHDDVPLGTGRRAVAWACFAIFLLTMVPVPVRL